MAKFDKEAIRAACRVEVTIPALLGMSPVKVSAGEVAVSCPFGHPNGDRHPSLHLNAEKQQWTCRVCPDTGGDIFAFVQKWKGIGFADAVAFLAQHAGLIPAQATTPWREVAHYDYHDEQGALVCRVVRYEPGENGKSKTFKQCRPRPDGQEGWIWNTEGLRLVPYRLPQLKRKEAAVICEGEKDVDVLWALGIPATTNIRGAGKWYDAYAAQLVTAGLKRVVVVADSDDPGRKHADAVARSCHAAGLTVKRLELPDGKDISDYLARHSKNELISLLKTAPAYEPPVAPKLGAVLTRMSDVVEEPISWVWERRIARGKCSLIMGDPGIGKSLLTIYMAAQISRGGEWIDGGRAPLGDVILLAAEDGKRDTIKPRLRAAGADASRVHVLDAIRDESSERPFSLERDLAYLEQAIAEVRPVLLVFDPISSYLGERDSYKDPEIRAVLMPLAALAERTGVAVVSSIHMTKDETRQAIKRALGGMAFTAVPRIVLAVADDPQAPGRRYLAGVKENICRRAPALPYRVAEAEGGAPFIEWEGGAGEDININDLLRQQGKVERDSAVDEAKAFLQEHLAGGPALATQVIEVSGLRGIHERTLRRAMVGIVESFKVGFRGPSYWRLVANAASDSAPNITTPCELATLGDSAPVNPEESTAFPKIAKSESLATFGEV